MLQTNELNAFYGEAQVLRNVSISVDQGQVVVMLGPNGHGKSTLLKAICGLAARVEGQIHYQGQEIQGRAAAGPMKRTTWRKYSPFFPG
jgi:branched-chain amino acid transport system ATP-binding protein